MKDENIPPLEQFHEIYLRFRKNPYFRLFEDFFVELQYIKFIYVVIYSYIYIYIIFNSIIR